MMAAIKAAQNKENQVTLIEKNDKVGKKLFITGKGRCNVTNSKDIGEFFENIPRNKEFLYSALYTFTNENLMDFFKSKGLELKVERGNRVFPLSDKATDVINVLKGELERQNVNLLLNTKVVDLFMEGSSIKYLLTNKGEIRGDWYIFTGGGVSYFGTGSDGTLHILAKKTGHKVTELKPSLIPLVLKDSYIMDLQGLSLKNVRFTLMNKNKQEFSDIGEMLFTHYGISGPLPICVFLL